MNRPAILVHLSRWTVRRSGRASPAARYAYLLRVGDTVGAVELSGEGFVFVDLTT